MVDGPVFLRFSRSHGRTPRIAIVGDKYDMKTFHEWLAERTAKAKNEGLWLNDKNAVVGLSRLNPLPKNFAVNKSLAKKPKPVKAKLGVTWMYGI